MAAGDRFRPFRGLSATLSLWLAIIFVFVALVGWHLIRDLSTIYERAIEVERANHQSHFLHELEMKVRAMVSSVHEFLITGSDRIPEQYRTYAIPVRTMLNASGDLGVDRSSILVLLDEMDRIAGQIFSLPFATGNMEGAILMRELDGRLARLAHMLSDRHRVMDQDVTDAMNMIAAFHLDMRDDFLLALLVLLLLLGVVSLHIYRRVVRPLGALRGEVARIGAGDFRPEAPDFGDNELGALSRALNRMGAALLERDRALEQAKSLAAHREKMHALGLMTASLAHEVGNPLAAATVSLDVCSHKLAKGAVAPARRYLEHAVEELRRTEAIIRSVLDFGRKEADGGASARLDLGELACSALRLVRLSRGARKRRLSVRLPDDLPAAFGNDGMAHQVLVNLLLNAVDASPEHGEIVVEGGYDARMVWLDVCDQGAGIPEEMREAVFSALFTTKRQGSGLGLSISRDLMRRMGGELALVQGDGGSCRFRMSLPLFSEGANPATKEGEDADTSG